MSKNDCCDGIICVVSLGYCYCCFSCTCYVLFDHRIWCTKRSVSIFLRIMNKICCRGSGFVLVRGLGYSSCCCCCCCCWSNSHSCSGFFCHHTHRSAKTMVVFVRSVRNKMNFCCVSGIGHVAGLGWCCCCDSCYCYWWYRCWFLYCCCWSNSDETGGSLSSAITTCCRDFTVAWNAAKTSSSGLCFVLGGAEVLVGAVITVSLESTRVLIGAGIVACTVIFVVVLLYRLQYTVLGFFLWFYLHFLVLCRTYITV